MMTEQRLQEIERRSTQGWRADWTETLEAVAEIRRLRAEVEQAQREAAACRHNYAVLCETGQRNDQPPALPPLPDKWQRQEYDSESVTFLNGPDFYFDAFASGVVMHIDDCFAERINVADLLIVLRHAEAAHQRLKEGHHV